VAEKFQTMIDKGAFNSRMKDFYDLYRIIIAHEFNEDDLMAAIVATFANRKTDFMPNHILFSVGFAEDHLFNQRWKAFCTKINISNPPTFVQLMDVIVGFIKPYWERLREV
jgi:hypothetical protein